MAAPYFFTVYDNNQNPLPEISGTWSLYCAEGKFRPPSEGELITSQSFTTGQSGEVEYNGGNPISVDSKYSNFGIVLQVDGYRTSFNTSGIENSGNVPTTSNLDITILTENQYIQEKIDNLKSTLSSRVNPA